MVLTINDLKKLPAEDILKLYGLPVVCVNDALLERMYDISKEVRAFEQLAELELEMLPVIDQLNDVEILFDIKGWYESQQELRERIKDLELYFNIDTALDNETPSLVEQLCIKTGISHKELSGKGALISENQLLARELFNKQNFWGMQCKILGKAVLGRNVLDSVAPITGKYRSFSAVSGRMSCRDLPLMSLPKVMYDFLQPSEGYNIWHLDFCQQEMRIASALTGCRVMQQELTAGKDVYAVLGQQFLSSESIDKCHKLGKSLLTPYLYGASEFTLKENLRKFTDEFADVNIQQKIRTAYPELSEGLDSYASNPFIRVTPYGNAPVFREFSTAQLRNLPIQGLGAVILKRLLIKLCSSGVRVLIPRHDEVILELPRTLDDESVNRVLTETASQVVEQELPTYVTKNFLKIKRSGEES